MSLRAIAIVVLATAVPGCTTLADVSAGQVGCPPAAITVSDENRTMGGTTWTAECNGQQYFCSAHGGGEGATTQVSCAPAGGGTNVPGGAGAAATPDPASGGCQYDTQCKGDRVCTSGACVDPTPAATPPAATPATPATPPAEATPPAA